MKAPPPRDLYDSPGDASRTPPCDHAQQAVAEQVHPPRTGMTRVHPAFVLACAASVSLCLAWACWPIRLPPLEAPVLGTHATARIVIRTDTFDAEAFRAPIWLAAVIPESAPEPPPTPPPAPLKLQLLAIFREGETYKATLYDPDSDRLFVVASGESVAGRHVDSITAESVTLRQGEDLRTLALRAEGSAVR